MKLRGYLLVSTVCFSLAVLLLLLAAPHLSSAIRLVALVLVVSGAGFSYGLWVKIKQATNSTLEQDHWQKLACRDELTAIFNRRGILSYGNSLKYPSRVVFLDIIGLKRINNNFGHAQGDHLLKDFANILQSSVRQQDIVGRWGGDEFVVLLQKATPAVDEVFRSRLRANLHSYNQRSGQQPYGIHARLGFAFLAVGESLEQAINRANVNAIS